jgi:hypothetical protein
MPAGASQRDDRTQNAGDHPSASAFDAQNRRRADAFSGATLAASRDQMLLDFMHRNLTKSLSISPARCASSR